jgi:5'-nucleotidase
MPRSGTLVFCLQNLDFSGANQVVLNIVSGRIHESNIVILSPTIGSFAARFVDTGVAVRIGDIDDLLLEITNVFCVICNTIMTCHTVVRMSERPLPVIWILHEWWDDQAIEENLKIRNIKHINVDTVKKALNQANRVVTVCASQRDLYNPGAKCDVIFVGVPDPFGNTLASGSDDNSDGGGLTRSRRNTEDVFYQPPEGVNERPFTFLCLGIVCPRKNQCWTVEAFKEFVKTIPDGETKVRLVIVGARETRVYEIEYLRKLRALIGDATNIELYDVTTNVEEYFQAADCLIITSLNEVTPMVISEAFSYGIPVISTNIAGIKEMYEDGVEGYLLDPGDTAKAVYGMEQIYHNNDLRVSMSHAARTRFETTFDVDLMVGQYRQLLNKVSPATILVDMDGTFVDWDKGFRKRWEAISDVPIERERSYYMEQCVALGESEERLQALDIITYPGFFRDLTPMDGALQALLEMESEGLKVLLVTNVVKGSSTCAQDKIQWIKHWLGERWLDRLVICQDKTKIRGDLLIDDKPFIEQDSVTRSTAVWKQVVFTAPYNKHLELPRLNVWSDWRSTLLPLLDNKESGKMKQMYRMHLMSPTTYRNKNRKSVRSKKEVDHKQLQTMHNLHMNDSKPLQPEGMASMLSGSAAQLDEGVEDLAHYEYDLHDRAMQRSATSVADLLAISIELEDKQRKQTQQYRRDRETAQANAALQEGEELDLEGLQVFQHSNKLWSYVKTRVKKNLSNGMLSNWNASATPSAAATTPTPSPGPGLVSGVIAAAQEVFGLSAKEDGMADDTLSALEIETEHSMPLSVMEETMEDKE